MKLFAASLVIAAAWLAGPADGALTWLTPLEHHFGAIPQGEPVRVSFRFRNVGGEALLIQNVRAGCGCTSPAWPDAPILPDSTASITVEYDAYNQGAFRKLIKVYVSTQRKAEKLYITGEVVPGRR